MARRELLAGGDRLFGLHRPGTDASPSTTPLEADIRDQALARGRHSRPGDHHLAALSATIRDPDALTEVNVEARATYRGRGTRHPQSASSL